jgi:dGTPase
VEKNPDILLNARRQLDAREEEIFSRWACPSNKGVRRNPDSKEDRGHRQRFSIDGDRILHSLAYSRYIDKTQVFYLIKNDHITHRVLHVQLVSKIARTVGRLLGLNEDLIEAISLGHDIGHTPFGHDGEKFLSRLCESHGIGAFLHNIQSVRFLQDIERKGKGWNLTLQVLDGILCHDGELYSKNLEPLWSKDFDALDAEMLEKQKNPAIDLRPMTMEGCVVRMADIISYVGRDIEDAIRLGLIGRSDIPENPARVLGDSNGTIVYCLVEDLVSQSLGAPFLCFSDEVGSALKELKTFNEEKIYRNPKVKEQTDKIALMFDLLFERYVVDLERGREDSEVFSGFLNGMCPRYRETTPDAGIVRDFIAGMTDEYFIRQCRHHFMPEMRPGFFQGA